MMDFFAYSILVILFLVFYFGFTGNIKTNKLKRQSLDDTAFRDRLEIKTKRNRIGSPRRKKQ